MDRRFFGKRVDVVTDEGSPNPTELAFEGEIHAVSEILLMWRDYSFPSNFRRHS